VKKRSVPEPKKKRGGGPPSKLNRQLMDDILLLVEAGNYLRDAVLANDIDEATYYRWIKKGAEDLKRGSRTLCAELCKSAPCARAKARVHHVGIILKNANSGRDTRASIEFLSRTDPENWARKDALKADLQHSGTLTIIFEEVGGRDGQAQGQKDSDVLEVPDGQS
jgi:hypothetical protein